MPGILFVIQTGQVNAGSSRLTGFMVAKKNSLPVLAATLSREFGGPERERVSGSSGAATVEETVVVGIEEECECMRLRLIATTAQPDHPDRVGSIGTRKDFCAQSQTVF